MKQYHTYIMNLNSKFTTASLSCMGMSVFLTALYYFGCNNLRDFSIGRLIFCLWFPLILSGAYIVLLKIRRFNAPGVYAIMGCIACLLEILGCFTSGHTGQGLFHIPMNLIAMVVLVIVIGGKFPYVAPAVILFGVIIGFRVVFFDLGSLDLLAWISEGAWLFLLSAFMLLPLCLTDISERKK